MSVSGIEAIGGFTPMVPLTLSTPAAGTTNPAGAVAETAAVTEARHAEFGNLLSQGMQNLEGLHDRADQLAVQAATGDLNALHDYTITATEAAVATQLTTAVRNKALESFQEIMRMSI